jgi:hypothetical protein
MTFRQQVGWCGRWGIVALPVASPIGPVTFGKLWPSPGAAARGIMDGIPTASAPFWRWWLHVDGEGRDRDA